MILTEWITSGNASVVIQGNRLAIADFCEIKINSFTDPIACSEPTTEPPPNITRPVIVEADQSLSNEEVVGIAAGIAAIIIVVVIAVSILLVIIVLWFGLKSKKKRK